MNLLLFHTAQGHLFPIGQKPQESEPPAAAPMSRRQSWKTTIQSGYQKLADKLNHEELLCANLRHATLLRVHHSSREDSRTTEKKFRQLLQMRYSKHSRWVWIDAVLAFFGIFLMFLPGPNIFFFYPAIRSLGHYHARNGARNVLNLADLSFESEPLIDEVQQKLYDLESVEWAISELQSRYEIDALKTVLVQLREK